MPCLCRVSLRGIQAGGLVDIVGDRITGTLAEPFEPAFLAASFR